MTKSQDIENIIYKIIKNSKKPVWYSDIVRKYGYDLETVVDCCDALEQQGKIVCSDLNVKIAEVK